MSNQKPFMNITNDTKTPVLSTPILESPSPLSSSSSHAKKKMSPVNSLHGQVKTPLYNLKEGETKLFEGLMDSPLKLLATTPVNTTPQVLSFSGKENVVTNFDGLASGIAMSPGVQESCNTLKVKIGMDRLKEESYKPQEIPRNESLLLDCFGLKVNDNSAYFSALKDQEWSDCREELNAGDITDTDASVGYIDACDKFQKEEYGIVVGGLVGELCRGLGKISLKEKRMTGFMGKHTRFLYCSDDEIKEGGDDHDDDEVESYYDCKSNVDDDVGKERGLVWELYNGFSLRSLTHNRMHEFMGKHTRFVYNSDDEIEGGEGVTESSVDLPDMFCI